MLHLYQTAYEGHEYTLLGILDTDDLAQAVEHYLLSAPKCAFCGRVLFPGTAVAFYDGEMAHACHALSACQTVGYVTDTGALAPTETFVTTTYKSRLGSPLVIPGARFDQYRFFEAVIR